MHFDLCYLKDEYINVFWGLLSKCCKNGVDTAMGFGNSM